MAEESGVLLTLDGRSHSVDEPLLCADDLAALRGDGVFETLLVRDGRACLIELHLRRLAQSARILELAEPDLTRWRAAIEAATRLWAEQAGDVRREAALRLIYSRGRESGSTPTAYVMVTGLPDRIAAARRTGIAALTLDRGLSATVADTAPWLLAGAKALSYAVNMAALRHASRQGADDVIFLSSEGLVLEGPRSTVVIAVDSEDPNDPRPCLLTPPPWYPILRGTTQQALFEVARAAGYGCDYRALRPADLHAARGVWLVSSLTLAARVHTLDGRRLPSSPIAAEFAALVDQAVISDR